MSSRNLTRYLIVFLLATSANAVQPDRDVEFIPRQLPRDTVYFGPRISAITEPVPAPTHYPGLADNKSEYNRTVVGYVWRLHSRWFVFYGAGLDISPAVWSGLLPIRNEENQGYSRVVPAIEIGVGVSF